MRQLSKDERVIRLAIDIGASGGKHIVSIQQNQNIVYEEIYRFSNSMDHSIQGLVWNLELLWDEIKHGIKLSTAKYPELLTIGIDMWGVDYVLLDEQDNVILPAYAYRDKRTLEVVDEVHGLIPFVELYNISGTQYQPFNTIYQLYSDKKQNRLEQATSFLMLPEYFIWKLTGVKIHEYTNATTTGLVDIDDKEYSNAIISTLGLNKQLFTEITIPGQIFDLKADMQQELLTNAKVVVVATHDTASAVEAIDIRANEVFISSGTWSLVGIKTEHLSVTDFSRQLNFTHEGGPGYIRLQKNIMGLWIIQCLKEEMGYESFQDIIDDAISSTYTRIFDVNDKRFLSPNNMKQMIIQYFNECGIIAPRTNKDILKSVFVSLADSYKVAINEIIAITNKPIKAVHLFGGGAKNEFLNELIRESIHAGLKIYPIEASSIGNLKLQGVYK